VFAAANWDQRSEKHRKWEALALGTIGTGPLAEVVGRGAVVLWLDDNPLRVWLEIGTASYASSIQATGIVFSRDRTMELARRLRRIAVALMADSWPLGDAEAENLFRRSREPVVAAGGKFPSLQSGYPSSAVTGQAGLLYLCEDPALDWVVLRGDLRIPGVRTWRARDALDGSPLYLYRCSEVGAAVPA
jgi:hypothetical protein